METYLGGVWFARLLFQRGLALVYLTAFLSALNQFRPLLGERGLLPVTEFLGSTSFRQAPSVFHLHYSDRFFAVCASAGIALSVVALTGISERGPIGLSFGIWFVLWALYQSIVNVGQTFYGFGWETMLLEAGFFAMFLGPAELAPSPWPVLALRWMLFRTEFGAGLIKLRHDRCWRDLTCLYYHYETQPLPNPLSWYFHRLPKSIHRGGVVFSHFVQLVVPFGLFAPQPIAAGAGALTIGHQLLLIVSGNYSWLNWLTVVLGLTALGDSVLPFAPPLAAGRPLAYEIVQYAVVGLTVLLSIRPLLNLFDRQQRMNYSYNPLHIVNSYGAFGSITRQRFEVVIEGSLDPASDLWKEYGFRGKPGDIERRPPQVAPYHLRLDWLMWFLALGGRITPQAWFLRLVDRLLENDRGVLSLLRQNPFPDRPPRAIRALLYRYEYTNWQERAETGAWWKRELVDEFHYRMSESG
jgi:hypothetical protein